MIVKKMNCIFLAIAAVTVLFKGCIGCFRGDEHQNTSITTGSTFYQECHCTEPGYTIDNLKWLDKNNQEIGALGPGTKSNVYTEQQNDSVNLHIPSISKTTSGTYKCVTVVAGAQYAQTYNVDAYDPLYFVDTPENQYVIYNKDSMIKCEAHGESNPIISWHKEQDELIEITNNEKYQVMPQGVIIRNVTKEDGGIYKCTALVYTTGEEVDRYIKVEVMTLPIIKELKAIPEATVVVSESLSVECIADGMPYPEYVWKKISEKSTNKNKTRNWRQVVNTIVFDSVQADDRGIYECTTNNSAGNDRKEIAIEVLVPPEIEEFQNITANEGSTVQIICNATGHSAPNITIIFDGKDPELDRDVEIIPNAAILKVERSHEGKYVCNASNEVEFVTKTMYMTVLHKPYFEEPVEMIWGWNGKSINLSCIHESNPQSNITWRYQGNDIPTEKQVNINKFLTEKLNSIPEHYMPLNIDTNSYYGGYECTAKNELGEATKVISLKEGFTPPDIMNVIPLETTATSITFSIDGPEKVEGPPVLGFTAEYDEAKNYNITNIHINRTWSIDRPFKLDKLKPDTEYFIKFAAVNEVGAGPWTESIVFETLEKSVPEPPVWEENSIQISSSNDHVLKWKAPEDNGDPIDYYTIRYCPIYAESDETVCKEERIEPTTEVDLSSLDYNTTYYLELVAHNSEGNSTAANISVTMPALMREYPVTFLSGGVIIGISVVAVLLCLLLLDLLLLVWRRQGIIASCCYKKNKKRKDEVIQSRDKKGLLKDNGESTANDSLKRPNNGHKEFEYNKNTGIVTGKHSAV